MPPDQSKIANQKSKTSVITAVRRKPALDFSMTGLVYCAMMLFMGLAAVNTQANLLFGVFGLMVGILLVSGVISRFVLRKLRVRRVLPDHGVVGRMMPVTYEFRNDKRFWPSLSVSVAEIDGADGFTRQPQCYLLHAAPSSTVSVPAEFFPMRRGLHQLERYQLSTSFPFGFVKRATNRRDKDTVLVLPPIGEVSPRLLAMCRSAENTGASMRPRPGGTDEFYGVREFRHGENPRLIYWKRSARTGVLVSREMTQVAPPRLLLAIDTFASDRSPEEHARIERTIAMAGSLASMALDQGMSVGLVAWTGHWATMNPDRGKRHRDDLLSVLARLPLNTEKGSTDLLDQIGDLLRSGTTPVLFTPRDVQLGLGERARGSMVVVSAASPLAEGWFKFDPEVDFATCMPVDQQPNIRAGTKARSHEATKGGATAAPPLRPSVP
jgi:uncharacterized protein (DUF58 family)